MILQFNQHLPVVPGNSFVIMDIVFLSFINVMEKMIVRISLMSPRRLAVVSLL